MWQLYELVQVPDFPDRKFAVIELVDEDMVIVEDAGDGHSCFLVTLQGTPELFKVVDYHSL